MDDELRKIVLLMVKLFRTQQERVLEVRARLDAMQVVLARATKVDLQESEAALGRIAAQFRSTERDAEAREQVDSIVALLDRGKDPDKQDS